jgi:hypothetical protein
MSQLEVPLAHAIPILMPSSALLRSLAFHRNFRAALGTEACVRVVVVSVMMIIGS